ncbi:MAG: CPBP family intramembrane glutamic endopeptidase [Thermincola sp.]|jgi:membrane protease YdiL (CAAX protease family)|nr:CPBP family intramembrane glutamic endopeptidase [Thermincola sp.]
METDSKNPKWSWLDAALVLAALFAMIPVAPALRHFLRQIYKLIDLSRVTQNSLQLFAGTLLQAGLIIAAVMLLTRRKGSSTRDLGLIWTNVGGNIKSGLLGGVVLSVTVIGLGVLVSVVIGPPPPQDVEKMLTGIKQGKDILLPFISVSILAPISEELYFRGMVYPLIRSKWGVRTALILSGFFFSAMHFDLYRLIPIGVGGMVLAYFYEKTGSLVTSITAHSTWNTLMLLMMFLARQTGL